jgi:transposase-like protein
MPQAKYKQCDYNFKKDFLSSRYEEIVRQYEDPIKAMVHRALEVYIEEAFEEFIRGKIGTYVTRSVDGKEVKEYRNGYRYIKHGVIEGLSLEQIRVPRNRAGGFRPGLLDRLREEICKVGLLASLLYINGLSTRKIRGSLDKAGIKFRGLSKSNVSRMVKNLVEEYVEWINRPITRKFIYIQVDTVYVKVKKLSNTRLGIMIAIGIDESGYKEVLYFQIGTEKTIQSDKLFQNLIRRGLDVNAVKLVTTDGARGPINSIIALFGEEKLQRCVVHKTENILKKCPKNIKGEMKAKLQRLWDCETHLEAQQYIELLCKDYEAIAPKAIACLLSDKDYLFKYLSFPMEHRKAIRNTNLIERVIREVRRRTKVMDNVLDNEYSVYALMTGIFQEQNERWNKKSHWSSK